MTQKELAEKAGLHELTILRVEKDITSTTVETLQKLADAFDVPIAALLPR